MSLKIKDKVVPVRAMNDTGSTLAQDGGEWSALYHSCYIPRERTSSEH